MKIPLINDSKGQPSATMTAFVLGFIVVNLKLILAGITIKSFTLGAFSGSEYSMCIAALGAVYVLRRSAGKEENKEENKGDE